MKKWHILVSFIAAAGVAVVGLEWLPCGTIWVLMQFAKYLISIGIDFTMTPALELPSLIVASIITLGSIACALWAYIMWVFIPIIMSHVTALNTLEAEEQK